MDAESRKAARRAKLANVKVSFGDATAEYMCKGKALEYTRKQLADPVEARIHNLLLVIESKAINIEQLQAPSQAPRKILSNSSGSASSSAGRTEPTQTLCGGRRTLVMTPHTQAALAYYEREKTEVEKTDPGKRGSCLVCLFGVSPAEIVEYNQQLRERSARIEVRASSPARAPSQHLVPAWRRGRLSAGGADGAALREG